MKIIKFNKNFYNQLQIIIEKRNSFSSKKIQEDVKKIIYDVKKKGDKSLIKFATKFDNVKINKKNLTLDLSKVKMQSKIDPKIFNSFKKAIKNISSFHKKQLPTNIVFKNNGAILKSEWKPIESVGLYVPGGKAFYPSSLIMNAVPAIIAKVKRIVCVTPPTKSINPYFVQLIKELGIKETYFVGGAQAISALTYGTETIKPVNKIFGPGNAYVAEAKKQLYGKVGIDLLAGPSEIIVVANNKNDPDWVASDLIAQAEHDENAQSILITDNKNFSSKVINSITKIKKDLPKKKIIEKSLNNNGVIILVDNIEHAAKIINFIAPEHLHLHISNYKKLLSKINNAGGIFLGEYSVEAFGDYIVGTNHVLPTSGAAKFSSGLGVLDFMKRNSVVEMNQKSFNTLSEDTQKMSGLEGLDGHKLSVKIRQKK